jgi:hypothetical protein
LRATAADVLHAPSDEETAMTNPIATPGRAPRRWRQALEFAVGCVLAALLLAVCVWLHTQGVPAVLAYPLPFALVSWIVGKRALL